MNQGLNHLIELRQRLLKSILLILAFFVPLFFYANRLFSLLAKPLVQYLNGPMIALNITAPLLIPIELAAKTAFVLAAPFVFYQLWTFIAPALYKKEKEPVIKFFIASCTLFYLGILFCYFIVMPLMFGFLAQTTPSSVKLMPDIGFYLSLSSRLFIVFGLAFQIPVLIAALIKSELINERSLSQIRPYFYVSAFTVGMLLTPPDVISQLLLAVPMCVLFELGIILCRPSLLRSDVKKIEPKKESRS